MIFFHLVFLFFPYALCNNCSTFTDGVLGGKYGKMEIKSYFPRFFVILSAYFTRGKYMIFFPLRLYISSCVFIFHLDHVIIVLLSQAVYRGKYFFPLCQCFPPVSMFFPWPYPS